MGGEADRQNAREQQEAADLAEFGPVQSVDDYAPTGIESSAQRDQMRNRLRRGDDTGYFETEAHELSPDLDIEEPRSNPYSIWNDPAKPRNVNIEAYRAGYEAYSIPYNGTMRALGRLKDLSLAGAPMTPAEFKMQSPDLAKRFQRLTSDGTQDTAFNLWSTQQALLTTEIQKVGVGQTEIKSARERLEALQARLGAKRIEYEKAEKSAELEKIDEADKTLAEIVRVTYDATGYVAEADEAMSHFSQLDASAEGPTGSDAPQSGNIDVEHGTDTDPTASQQGVARTTGQKAGDAAHAVAAYGGSAENIAAEIRKRWAGPDTALSLSLEDIFKVATGNAKQYQSLMTGIAELDKRLGELNLQEEQLDLKSAKDGLAGATMQYEAVRRAVQTDRIMSRRDAAGYASSMKTGADGVMAMYVVEASEELAEFGAVADEERRNMVDPLWTPLRDWFRDTDALHFEGDANEEDDAIALIDNLKEVASERAFLTSHLSEWQQTARDWEAFFAAPLLPGGSDADLENK